MSSSIACMCYIIFDLMYLLSNKSKSIRDFWKGQTIDQPNCCVVVTSVKFTFTKKASKLAFWKFRVL